MSEEIYAKYPPDLDPVEREYLLSSIKNWSIEHGLAVRPQPSFIPQESDPHGILATNAPVTLFPSPFPRKCFEEARALQKAYNELYAAISMDEEWLGNIMEELISVDPFISSLWSVHLACKQEGYVQPLSLGLFRSDYMLDAPTNTIKQVEFNTISSSFGGLSTLVSALHTHLLTSPTPAYPAHPVLHPQALPPNNAIASLASGLASAHEAYGLSKSHPALPCCILILTQDPNERNIFDQLHLTSALQSPPYCIPVFRLPISDILTLTTIPDSNLSRPLIYKPPHSPHAPYEVTTLYLRALYSPTDHPTPSSWEARLHLERSLAIKCPSILLQLAGCKKVQQVLATPLPTSTKIDPPSDTSSDPAANPPPNSEDPLSHFLPNYSPHTISLLRSTFAPQYALSSERGTSLALDPTTARNHVLKPQREGGGNNIYHEDITKYLNSLSLSPSSHPSDPSSSSSDTKAEEIKSKTAEYARWVLMELIHPPTSAHNTILKSNGSVVSAPTVSELGIFGIALWENPSIATPIPESQRPSLTTVSSTDSEDIPVFDEYKPKEELMKVDEGIEAVLLPSKERARPQILVNEEAGWLLRTKGQDSDEGGVATGFACVDSVVLVDL